MALILLMCSRTSVCSLDFRRSLLIGTLLLLLSPLRPDSASADPADANWSSNFGAPGVEGEVRSMVTWNGMPVLGGDIPYAGGKRVHNVVAWNGTELVELGAGLDGPVHSLVVVGTTLFAAGDFTASGATPLPNVARWTGTAWVAVGSGAPDDPTALSLAVDGSNLLLLGAFTTVGAPPVAAEQIASWNGSAWSAVGNFDGADGGHLNAAIRLGSRLYVGGTFASTSSLHSWNGSSWTYDIGGIDGDILSMATIGTDLYLHGSFGSVADGSVPAEQLARFDGTDFFSLNDVSPGGGVYRIGVDSGQLFVVGSFLNDPGPLCAYWDGASWTGGPARISGPGPFGGGVWISAFARVGGDLFLGGGFTSFYDYTDGGVQKGARSIAAWNGTQFRALGPGFGVTDNGSVQALTTFNTQLIAAGDFQRIGRAGNVRGIAAWDGASWAPLGAGLIDPMGNPSGDNLTTWNGRVVVSGYFTGAGAISSKNIAAWNGAAWEGFAGGLNGQGARMVDYASQLIASGLLEFEIGSGNPLGHVARWTGTQWQTIGTVAPSFGASATRSTVWSGKLVTGGLFSSINGVPAANIAQWNGTTWSALGNGLNGIVSALVAHNGDLYAAGGFTASGATSLPGHVARWNGSAWLPLGIGVDAEVFQIASAGGLLFVTGNFGMAGGVPAAGIASWNGTTWSALGTGLGQLPGHFGRSGNALTSLNGGLFVGGFFTTAGDKASRKLARWQLGASTAVDPVASEREIWLSRPSQNPAHGEVSLSFGLPRVSHVEAAMFDVRGRRIRTLASGRFAADVHRLTWDGRDDAGERVSSGVYWVRLGTTLGQVDRKVVWLR